jgi:hypothetical protein
MRNARLKTVKLGAKMSLPPVANVKSPHEDERAGRDGHLRQALS